MIELFHIPTLMLCFFTGSAIVAVFVTAMWVRERDRLDLLFWAGAFCIGSAGVLLLALRSAVPSWLALGFGNMLAVTSPGLFLVGLLVFDGKRANLWLAGAAPAIWGVAYFCTPGFAGDINARVMLYSALVLVLSALVAYQAWKGWLKEGSTARMMVVVFFATHALIFFSRIPMAVLYPLSEGEGYSSAGWFGYFAFEIYVHSLSAGMAIFVMLRDRVERRYREASEADPLTGVVNRRAFLSRSDASMRRSQGGALALIDIDHFKRINDGYGHPAGDAALCAFCRWIESDISDGMIFGRIGGEEFALWLPNIDGAQALELCERLRAKVAASAVEAQQGALRFTVSIGVCTDLPRDGDMEFAIGVADHALYLSKRGGRDRVTAIRADQGVERATEALGEMTGTGQGSALAGVAAVRLV